MFALTQKRFDAWVHIHETPVPWKQLDKLRCENKWDDVYVSLYAKPTWLLPTPSWAIAVPSGPLKTLLDTEGSLLSFDATFDVVEGPQRCEEINFPHQIRLLTSDAPRDLELTRRFIRASAFSPYLWRLTLEHRLTRAPLDANLFKLNGTSIPLMGQQEFLAAEDVGAEYVFSNASLKPFNCGQIV